LKFENQVNSFYVMKFLPFGLTTSEYFMLNMATDWCFFLLLNN